MTGKRVSILFVILAMVLGNSIAQTNHRILAKIQDSTTQQPVPFAFVASNKTGIGKETNTNGVFKMDIADTDTILFRCMGYEDNRWAISNIDLSSDTLTLMVNSKEYVLNEIKVVNFRSYAAFRSMVANMPMMETGEYKLPFKIDVSSVKGDIKMAAGSFGVGMSLNWCKQTPEEKKYNKILANENLYSLYNKLTSRDNLQAFTQLNGASLDSFIVFLRTKHNIDPKLSEYDMMVEVSSAFDHFLAARSDSTTINF
nr:carboxypeptidase-like regulatory domain-containing protein [uncultured Carboxylicivirga sp.]